jgi:hypothetical protein
LGLKSTFHTVHNNDILWLELLFEKYKYKNEISARQTNKIQLVAAQSYGLEVISFYEINKKKNIIVSILFCYLSKEMRIIPFRDPLLEKLNQSFISYIGDYCKSNNIKSVNLLLFDHSKRFEINNNALSNISLHLQNEEILQWDKFSDKTRNMIRKGINNNLEISRCKKYMLDCYKIYTKNMLNKGLLPHSYSLFSAIIADENCTLFTVIKSGNVISSAGVIKNHDYAEYFYHSGDLKYKKLSPNQFLIWEIIKWSINNKVRTLDFGEATYGSGVFKFKKSFGGSITNVYKIYLNLHDDFRFNLKNYFNEMIVNKNEIKSEHDNINIFNKLVIRLKLKFIIFGMLKILPISLLSIFLRVLKRKKGLGI